MLPPTTREIFFAFLRITVLAFGNAMSWVHRGLVYDRGWMSEEQFAQTLSLCQSLPGPNITNFAVIAGWRWRGLPGAIAAITALLVPPTILLTILGAFYDGVANVPVVRGIFNGLASVAAGLFIVILMKSVVIVAKARPVTALATVAISCAAIVGGVLSVPLALVTLGPLSIALAWLRRRA